MNEDTFEDYLVRAEKLGVIDFHLRLMRSPEGKLDFYIHPQNADGETGDFTVSGSFVSKINGNVAAGSSRPAVAPLAASAAKPEPRMSISDLAIDRDIRVGELTEALDEALAMIGNLAGSLRFILAFYEPGQKYLDTVAWANAEKSGRYRLAEAEKYLASRSDSAIPGVG